MLVELKNGEMYNGVLQNVDGWMNMDLKTDGDKFWKLDECFVRGNTIKCMRIPDQIVDMVQAEEAVRKLNAPYGGYRGRGDGGHRGRGDGGRGRGRGDRGRGRGDGGRGRGRST